MALKEKKIHLLKPNNPHISPWWSPVYCGNKGGLRASKLANTTCRTCLLREAQLNASQTTL